MACSRSLAGARKEKVPTSESVVAVSGQRPPFEREDQRSADHHRPNKASERIRWPMHTRRDRSPGLEETDADTPRRDRSAKPEWSGDTPAEVNNHKADEHAAHDMATGKTWGIEAAMLLKEQNRCTRPVDEKLDSVLETEADCEAAANESGAAAPDREKGNYGEDERGRRSWGGAHIAQELGECAARKIVGLNPLANGNITGKAIINGRPRRQSDRAAEQCQPGGGDPGANAQSANGVEAAAHLRILSAASFLGSGHGARRYAIRAGVR